MPSDEGVGARRAALRLLDSVLRRGQTLERAASSIGSLAPADHALALAIAGETLRRLPDLDELIDSATRQRLPDDSKARMVLRLALAQKIALRTPEHALVATALPLVDGGPRRLVHGVLGTLLRREIALGEAPKLPAAIEDRWGKAWGMDAVAAARRLLAKRPPLDLTFADEAEAQDYAERCGGTSLAPYHVRLLAAAVPELPGFEEGHWWIQDLAASLPARLIPAKAENVLDLCAAPGGKTMQLAAAGHRVTSLDLSAVVLDDFGRILHERTSTLALSKLTPSSCRARANMTAFLSTRPVPRPEPSVVHPEVLHRARARIITESAALQGRLLDVAAASLKAGGALVYSVCSLEPQEGEEVVTAFLERHPEFTLDAPAGLPDFAPVSTFGWVRILPTILESEGGLDGFFIARLVRAD